LIPTQIRIPLAGWLSPGEAIKRAVHLFCPWKTVTLGEKLDDLSYGRDYLLAESTSGAIWGLYGDSVLVRKMHPKAKEVHWPPGKSVKLHIQHLLRKGYKVVGEMDAEGCWKSNYFSYTSQPIARIKQLGNTGDSLQERYPLSEKMKKNLKGITGPEWF
jgi:hypothetical protein